MLSSVDSKQTHGTCCAIAMSRWVGRKHCKISSAASPISRKGDWTTHFQIGPNNPSTGWNLKIITSQWESNTRFSSRLFSTCSFHVILWQILQKLMCRKKKTWKNIWGQFMAPNILEIPSKNLKDVEQKTWKHLHEPPKRHLFFSSWTRGVSSSFFVVDPPIHFFFGRNPTNQLITRAPKTEES